MRSLAKLLELIELAKSGPLAVVEVAHLAASMPDEEVELLWQYDLEARGLPRLERAVERLRVAQRSGHLGEVSRAQQRLGRAVVAVGRCLVYGAELLDKEMNSGRSGTGVFEGRDQAVCRDVGVGQV